MSQSKMKNLAKETAIYGVSSIVGKFLNWLLVPLFTRILTEAEYGVIGQLYAYIALFVIILTYGMETGYFRFASDKEYGNPDKVYSTTMMSVGFTSLIFSILIIIFYRPLAAIMNLADYEHIVLIMAITVAIDAFLSIPFSYLRFKQKAIKFMIIKMIIIFTNIAFNLFFLLLCPAISTSNISWLIDWFYIPGHDVGYIVIANCISTLIGLLCLLPEIFVVRWKFDFNLLKKMLHYSMPLLLLGVVGIMNQTVDRIIFNYFYDGSLEEARAQVGLYNAAFKVSMVMMMFTYAFRFAYEPFIFSQKSEGEGRQTYSVAMTYFVITVTMIYLLIITFIDILKLVIGGDFRVAIPIIPFVLITYAFQGIYYNLSLWYKLTDRTIWGTYFSLIGFIITLVFNILFIPTMSYWACVFASLISFFVMMVACYFVGQRYYPIKYDLKKIFSYILVTAPIGIIMLFIEFDNILINTSLRLILFVPFVCYVLKKELPTEQIINSLISKITHK